MLLPLLQQGFRNITFVAGRQHQPSLEAIIEKALCHSEATIKYVEQPEPRGPGDAFALTASLITGPTLLLLGDTLSQLPSDYDQDWIGVAPVPPGTHSQWCTVEINDTGIVDRLIDKPTSVPAPDWAAVGLYFFKDGAALRFAMVKATAEADGSDGEFQLKPILDHYMQVRPVRAVEIVDWRDLGTLRSYNDAVRSSLPGRSFTRLNVSPAGRIDKRTSEGVGLEAGEAAWFTSIPSRARLLAPRFLGSGDEGNGYALEYLDYLTLAEYFTFGYLSSDIWPDIIGQLLELLSDNLWQWRDVTDMQARTRAVLVDKTLRRLRSWTRQDLLTLETYEVNGTRLPGFKHLWGTAMPAVEEVARTSQKFASTIHGDLSFGNILYSPRAGIFRLLDPRGSFGAEGPLGDLRYEGAKLRQCYHGRYDVVAADLFAIKEPRPGVFEVRLYPTDLPSVDPIDRQLTDLGFDVALLQLIEALLFLSMIPLHQESIARQLVFFIIAMQCLEGSVAVT